MRWLSCSAMVIWRDFRPRPYVFRGMLMGWRFMQRHWEVREGSSQVETQRKKGPWERHHCAQTRDRLPWERLIRTAQTGPEGRTRRDEWNSRETDFSLTQGRPLTQLELSCPMVDSAALEAMNPKGFTRENQRGPCSPAHRGVFTDAVTFTLLYVLHCTYHLRWSCFSVDLPTVSLPVECKPHGNQDHIHLASCCVPRTQNGAWHMVGGWWILVQWVREG